MHVFNILLVFLFTLSVNTENDTNIECFHDTHELWDSLLKKHVSNEGKVNYEGFKKDYYLLKEYISKLDQNVPKNSCSKKVKLAYWINAYNALTIDLILRNYPLKSIKDIKNPLKQKLWELDDKKYNLDEIEHEILRKMDEPRIHFAIVCASFSCPKLQNEAFKVEKIEEQLTNATKEFLNDSKRNSISPNEMKLSKIFQWFEKDFKQNGSLIDFLNQYAQVHISPKAKIKYKEYDWSLNE